MNAVTADPLDLIAEHYGHLRNAAKLLANITDASVPTVKNWLARKNMPQWMHIMRIMAEDEAFKADIDRLIAAQKARRKNAGNVGGLVAGDAGSDGRLRSVVADRDC